VICTFARSILKLTCVWAWHSIVIEIIYHDFTCDTGLIVGQAYLLTCIFTAVACGSLSGPYCVPVNGLLLPAQSRWLLEPTAVQPESVVGLNPMSAALSSLSKERRDQLSKALSALSKLATGKPVIVSDPETGEQQEVTVVQLELDPNGTTGTPQLTPEQLRMIEQLLMQTRATNVQGPGQQLQQRARADAASGPTATASHPRPRHLDPSDPDFDTDLAGAELTRTPPTAARQPQREKNTVQQPGSGHQRFDQQFASQERPASQRQAANVDRSNERQHKTTAGNEQKPSRKPNAAGEKRSPQPRR
jgi:hypothetical protein